MPFGRCARSTAAVAAAAGRRVKALRGVRPAVEPLEWQGRPSREAEVDSFRLRLLECTVRCSCQRFQLRPPGEPDTLSTGFSRGSTRGSRGLHRHHICIM